MIKFLLALITVLSFSAQSAERILLTPQNHITIRGEINDYTMTKAQIELFSASIKRGIMQYPIYIVLDSPGGSIDAGNNFIQLAKTIRNVKTITIFSASMASAIVEALPGDRLMTENGELMFHRASSAYSGQIEDGEVESRLMHSKAVVRKMELQNSGRMQMSLSAYKERVKDEWWMDVSSALKSNAVDRQIDIICSKELFLRTEEIQVMTIVGPVNFKFSSCPLIRAPIFGNQEQSYKVPSSRTMKQ